MANSIYNRICESVEADLNALRSAVCKTPDEEADFDRAICLGDRFTKSEALTTLVNALSTSPGRPKWPVAAHVLPLFRQRADAGILADRIEAYIDTAKPRPFSLREIVALADE